MSELVFARAAPNGRAAVVSVPRIDATGGGWSVYAPMRALWLLASDRVIRLSHPGPWSVVGLDDGVLAWSIAGVDVLAGADLEVVEDPRVRLGGALRAARAPGGPWTVANVVLPEGAAWSRSLRPWPRGRGLAWEADGYVYSWPLDRSPRAIGRGRELHFDPAGRPVAGPAPLTDPAPVGFPGDTTRGRRELAGLAVVAWRDEGDLTRGWTRDGVELLAPREA